MAIEQQNWDPCPAGELAKMVQVRRSQRRRQVIDRVAVVGACFMVCIAIGGYTLGVFTPDPSAGSDLGGLACSEVLESLPTYIEGDMDPQMQERMAVHLKNCPHCQSHHDELLKSVSSRFRAAILFAHLTR